MEVIELKNTLPKVFENSNFGEKSEVWHQNLCFEKGENYLISAESGTGKSSLCSYLYGFRNDYSGEILFDNDNISNFNIKDWCNIRERQIAYLPQELRLFPELTALENVKLKNNLTHHKSDLDIKYYFEILGIDDKINQKVALLSIGQQQRVALIRTICQPADFYILDEPVSHLDERNNQIVSDLLMKEALSVGAGIIATSVGYNVSINFNKTLML